MADMGTTMVKEFIHIVLVDDDSDDRDLFGEAMSFINPGANVEMKRDGEELMEHLANDLRPDVIFLDLNMPRKNGRECLSELRADRKFQHLPIVVYTTSLNPVDIQDTFELGATLFLRKPNSFEQLKDVLSVVLATLKISLMRTPENFVVNPTLNLYEEYNQRR